MSSTRTRRPVSARALETLRQAEWASLEAAESVNALVWLPPFNSVGMARGVEKDFSDSQQERRQRRYRMMGGCLGVL